MRACFGVTMVTKIILKRNGETVWAKPKRRNVLTCVKRFFIDVALEVCVSVVLQFFFLSKKFVFPADFLLIPSERFNILSNLLYAYFGKVM